MYKVVPDKPITVYGLIKCAYADMVDDELERARKDLERAIKAIDGGGGLETIVKAGR